MYKHVRDSIFPDKTPNYQSTNSADVDIIRAVDLLYIKKKKPRDFGFRFSYITF